MGDAFLEVVILVNGSTMTRRHDPRHFFTPDEIDRLVHAMERVESKSTGRILLHLERRCPITDPLSRAIKIFHQLNLGKTPERNGVLIYFATEYQFFAVLGDEGLNRRVPPGFWREVRMAMEAQFEEQKFLEGTFEAIHKIEDHLAKFFPRVTA